MQVRYVVAAVEIVIDENFPIAVEHVVPPLEPVKVTDIEIDEVRHLRTVRVEPRQYPSLPNRDFDGHETHRVPIKIADGSQIGSTFQVSVEGIGPAVIGTLHVIGFAA